MGTTDEVGKSIIKVGFTISNLLEEQVFVTVTGYDRLSCNLRSEDGHLALIGGGGGVAFPDNTELLKRLHGSSYDTGERWTCGCASVHITGGIPIPTDYVSDLVGAYGELSIRITGFFLKNGEDFSETIVIPIRIGALKKRK